VHDGVICWQDGRTTSNSLKCQATDWKWMFIGARAGDRAPVSVDHARQQTALQFCAPPPSPGYHIPPLISPKVCTSANLFDIVRSHSHSVLKQDTSASHLGSFEAFLRRLRALCSSAFIAAAPSSCIGGASLHFLPVYIRICKYIVLKGWGVGVGGGGVRPSKACLQRATRR